MINTGIGDPCAGWKNLRSSISQENKISFAKKTKKKNLEETALPSTPEEDAGVLRGEEDVVETGEDVKDQAEDDETGDDDE